MKIHQSFTGGNIRVLRQQGNDIYLENELRDTQGDWFYWAFCVEGAEGMTLTFHFSPNRLGYYGPAVSHDARTWHWLGSCDGDSFTYTFGEGEASVYFAHNLLYHPDRFLALAEKQNLKVEPLCVTKKGRTVPCTAFGEGELQVILTARHHACESTGDYVLEGVLSELSDSPEANKLLRVLCVPFVDYDGVVDGDQGKGRAPYDHNRDYAADAAPLYPTTQAIRKYAEENGCHFGIDFHSPWHKGGRNDTVFIVQNSFEKEERLRAFSACLAQEVTEESMDYKSENDIPFMTEWNRGAPTFAAFMTARPENDVAFTLETAYFGTPDNRVTDARLVSLGRAFARALLSYIAAHHPKTLTP